MVHFYMMFGLPGSGKSYYANNLSSIEHRDIEVVSSDAIRKELFGDENDQEHNNEVFNEVHNRIYHAIKDGRDVCYDATNLSRKRRKAFLKSLDQIKEVTLIKHCIVIATHYDICREQNESRERIVPSEVILRMYKNLTFPRLDEGWDFIRVIGARNIVSNIDTGYYYHQCIGFNQDNPHHNLTLDEHLKKCQQGVIDVAGATSDFDTLTQAALLHDIGKPVCKTYTNFNGTVDDHAHYYNHAEVGAYMVACCYSTGKELIQSRVSPFSSPEFRTILLIQWHMEFFNTNYDVLKKVDDLYGRGFANDLRILHNADVDAH